MAPSRRQLIKLALMPLRSTPGFSPLKNFFGRRTLLFLHFIHLTTIYCGRAIELALYVCVTRFGSEVRIGECAS
jgi:hypothetical protein